MMDEQEAKLREQIVEVMAAMDARGMRDAGWTAESLALHTQVVLQGAFVLAKARDSVSVAIDSINHLKRYVTLLFSHPVEKAA